MASWRELASFNSGEDINATIASSNFPPSSDFNSSTRFWEKKMKEIDFLKDDNS